MAPVLMQTGASRGNANNADWCTYVEVRHRYDASKYTVVYGPTVYSVSGSFYAVSR